MILEIESPYGEFFGALEFRINTDKFACGESSIKEFQSSGVHDVMGANWTLVEITICV